MSQTESTTSQPETANIAEWRTHNSHLSPLALCVAANSHSTAETIEWRDIFCNDCGMSECLNGSAEQLAEKVVALGWIVSNIKQFDALCPAYREVS